MSFAPRLAPVLALAVLCGTAHGRGDPRIEFELAAGVSGSTELRTVALMSPLVTISAPISEKTAFLAQWGFSVATGEPRGAFDATWFAVGNPLIGASLVLLEGLVFSPSLTFPVAKRPDGEARRPASSFAFDGAIGMRGATDLWLWAPDELAVVLPLAWVKWLDPLLLEAHVKLAFLAPTTSDDNDSDFILQMKARLALHIADGVWIGAGLSGVYTPTDTVDNFQSALTPELRYVLGPGSHVGLTLNMNLDTPYGPFSTPGRFWAVVIGGSARL